MTAPPPDWPNRASSRLLQLGPVRWHVQVAGTGPALLLLHGTGASAHSWRDLIPLLSERFTVVAPDLPGHGFTHGRPPGGLTLPAMATAVTGLLAALEVRPVLAAAHSAGTAVAMQMASKGALQCPVIGFGAALTPFPGPAARLFPFLARAVFVNPFAAGLFARIAAVPGEVDRFLRRSTGSVIDANGVRLYERLFRDPAHCGGAIEMMADWDLEALQPALAARPVPLHLVHGDRDAAISATNARAVPAESFELLSGLGHLAHEERPDLAAATILRIATVAGLIPVATAAAEPP